MDPKWSCYWCGELEEDCRHIGVYGHPAKPKGPRPKAIALGGPKPEPMDDEHTKPTPAPKDFGYCAMWRCGQKAGPVGYCDQHTGALTWP